MDDLVALAPSSRLVDNVYEALREAILAGQLPAGTRLRVPQLADRLGVSRSPIREAVLRLTREGLAAEEPRKGVVVASITLTDLIDLYYLREVLEGLAARLAAQRGGSAFIKELESTVAEHASAVKKGDLAAHYDADARFHQLIHTHSGNPALEQSMHDLQSKIRLAMRTTQISGGPTQALADHRRILSAIKKADPSEAEAASRQHVERLRLKMTKELSPSPKPNAEKTFAA